MARLFDRVAIAGVGLIGGSLALAARAAGLIGEVVGTGRTEANLQIAQQRGIIDRYDLDPAEAARDADLLVLAVPVKALGALAGRCARTLRPGAVVTDVGSVKAPVVQQVEAALPPGFAFVGAHPIAGTEQSGAAAAFAELFQGCRCILTPGARAHPAATQKIRTLWEGVGMRVDEMEPARHDQVLAWVSHLPHTIAFSAVNALLQADGSMEQFGGSSFRDLTRVAASSVEMWVDILLDNAAQVDSAVQQFIATLEELRGLIAAGEPERLRAALLRARAARLQWTTARS